MFNYLLRNNNEYLKLLLFIGLSSIFFSSILSTGHLADDAYNSSIRGSLMYSNTSLFDRTVAEINGWIFGAGRIFVLNWIWIYSLFYFFTSTIAVKIIGLIILNLNFIIFYFINKNLTKSSDFALLSVLLFPLIIQYNIGNDPVLAYAFFVPLQFLLIQISLLFFLKSLDKANKFLSISSVFIYTCALSIYELAYPLFVIFFLMAFIKNKDLKKSFFKTLPYALISLLFILFMFYLKFFVIKTSIHPEGTYPFSNPHLDDLKLFFQALYIQILAGFPGVNWFSDIKASLYFSWKDIFNLLLLVTIIIHLRNISTISNIKLSKVFILIGLFLIIFPATIVSMSGHQDYLVKMGIGSTYLSVFIQYFGVSIILIYFILKYLNNKLRLFLFVPIIIALFVTNLGLNNKVVKSLGATYKYPREILEAAHSKDFFSHMKDDSYLYRYMLVPSDYHWSYATVIGKKFHTCELAQIDQRAIDGGDNYLNCLSSTNETSIFDLSSKDAWVLTYNIDRKYGKNGRMILAKINSIELDDDMSIKRLNTKKIRYYDLKDNEVYDLELNNEFNFIELTDERFLSYKKLKPFPLSLK
jgi:hypothetical protein